MSVLHTPTKYGSNYTLNFLNANHLILDSDNTYTDWYSVSYLVWWLCWLHCLFFTFSLWYYLFLLLLLVVLFNWKFLWKPLITLYVRSFSSNNNNTLALSPSLTYTRTHTKNFVEYQNITTINLKKTSKLRCVTNVRIRFNLHYPFSASRTFTNRVHTLIHTLTTFVE